MSATVPPELLEKLRAKIAAEPPPAKAPSRAFGVLVSVVAFALIAMRGRPDLAALPLPHLLLSTSLLVLCGIAALTIARSRGRFGLGAPVERLALVVIGAAPAYAIMTMIDPLRPSGMPLPHPTIGDVLAHAVPCLTAGMLVGLVVLFASAWTMRRTTPSAASMRGAAIGGFAGLAAAIALHLHCPLCDRGHLMLGHTLPIALLVIVGAVATPRILRP